MTLFDHLAAHPVGMFHSLLAVASRVPGWSFGAAVAFSSMLVIGVGIWIMLRLIPGVVGAADGRARTH